MQYDFHNSYPLARLVVPRAGLVGLGVGPRLAAWLTAGDVRAQRRLLLADGTLATSKEAARFVARVEAEPPSRLARQLRRDAEVLRRAAEMSYRAAGVSCRAAVGRAYVDVYGGFADDLPRWLLRVEARLGELLDDRHRLRLSRRRVALLTGALRRLDATAPPGYPDARATLLRELAVATAEDLRAPRLAAYDRAVGLAEEALAACRARDLPYQEAVTATALGTLLMDRVGGELAANHRRAEELHRAAVEFFDPGRYPVEHAEALVGLAIDYQYGRARERRANQEQAIVWYHEALRIFAAYGVEQPLARTRYFLGTAFWQRDSGDRRDNLEQAIRCLRGAAGHWAAELPVQHARVRHGLGLMHLERLAGDVTENIELALDYTSGVLPVFTREEFPVQHGQTLLNLAGMYQRRIAGDHAENLATAVRLLRSALRIRTLEAFPNEYAVTQLMLGRTHALLAAAADPAVPDPAASGGSLGAGLARRVDELRAAESCYLEALRVWTLEVSPRDNWEVLLQLAQARADGGRWAEAARAYGEAIHAEELLLGRGTGVAGVDAVLSQGRDAATRRAFALRHAGDPAGAALCVELGRARVLAQESLIDAANPEDIADPARRADFVAARADLVSAHAALSETAPETLGILERQVAELDRMRRFHGARARFDRIVAAVRAAGDPPDFLAESCDLDTLRGAAGALGTGGAVVYVLPTPWGGLALAVRDRSAGGGVVALDLPGLTDDLLVPLLEHLGLAQDGDCLAALAERHPGRTTLDCLAGLARTGAGGPEPILVAAGRQAAARPLFAALAALPLDLLGPRERGLLDETLAEALVRVVLERAEPTLGAVVTEPLTAWLGDLGLDRVALVVCGGLAALPLTSLRRADGRCLADLFVTSVVPNARILDRRRWGPGERAADRPGARGPVGPVGMVAVGDPTGSLPWSRVEAASVLAIARRAGLRAHLLTEEGATRVGLLDALAQGQIVTVACHGTFDRRDSLGSALHLAGGERVTLGEILARAVDLRGLRLLVLSACQSATLDTGRVPDEMRSMAGAMLQAGAGVVLAALWPVDDRATCLLVSRFVAQWLDGGAGPPGPALARAQRWLRTATGAELAGWQASLGVLDGPAGAAAVRGRVRRARTPTPVAGAPPVDSPVAVGAIRLPEGPGGPADRPYANPYFWAGLQVFGW
ncbi:CHAT domain-containing protein [Parafrankia discariae]|uniref:CHAT domain-containing protein n=1 Tax=Parafrankia discariae TaxID=365528 RepID=UPI0003795573|nr:CHAT domain-containing protein [Parafrankia discariae]